MAEEEKKTKTQIKEEEVAAEVAAIEKTGIDDAVFYPPHDKEYPVVSAAAARALGFRRYFTGVECKNGHIAPRTLKSNRCIKCQAEKVKQLAARKREAKAAEKAAAA